MTVLINVLFSSLESESLNPRYEYISKKLNWFSTGYHQKQCSFNPVSVHVNTCENIKSYSKTFKPDDINQTANLRKGIVSADNIPLNDLNKKEFNRDPQHFNNSDDSSINQSNKWEIPRRFTPDNFDKNDQILIQVSNPYIMDKSQLSTQDLWKLQQHTSKVQKKGKLVQKARDIIKAQGNYSHNQNSVFWTKHMLLFFVSNLKSSITSN